MMRTVHNKLVRDHIPEIIRQAGQNCGVETMEEQEFHRALRAKLVEEAQEAAAATGADLVTELADLCEVMDALMAVCGIDRETVLKEQQRRQVERGGLSRRIRLLWSGAD